MTDCKWRQKRMAGQNLGLSVDILHFVHSFSSEVPHRSGDSDSDASFTCAICFGDFEQRADLPCDCKVAYCAACWDQALARSFQASGCAQCPTCRAAVRADFDPMKESLVFTRDADMRLSGDACQSRVASHQRDLAAKALPVQIRLLRRFGQALPHHLLVSPSESAKLDPSTHAELCATAVSERPLCICGSFLHRLSAEQRAHLWCRMRAPDLNPDSPQFAQLLLSAQSTGSSYCDLCDTCTPPHSSVWTCSNGDRTIMHANAFDICDACFVKHACAVKEAEPDTCDLDA